MNVIQSFSSRRALVLATGALVLGLGAFAMTMRCSCKAAPMQIERWVLQADRDPLCYYGSAWNGGDLLMPLAAHNQTVRFIHPYHHDDDCEWRGTETLTPDGNGNYLYHYDDEVLSCPEDSEPAPACPLDGTVRIVPVMLE